jgi:preprotein translocase subunit SecA
MIDDTVEGYVVGATEGVPEEWDLSTLWTALKQLYPVKVTQDELEDEAGGLDHLTRESMSEAILSDAQAAYDAREEALTPEVLRELERQVLLAVLDRKWREHLYEMDYLREGIGLRAYSQRDPLVEYQREGFELFQAMMESIKEEAVGFLFHVEVQREQRVDPAEAELEAAAAALVAGGPVGTATAAQANPQVDSAADETAAADVADEVHEHVPAGDHRPHIRAKGIEAPKQPKNLSYSAPTLDGDAGTEVHRDEEEDIYAGASRNKPCPCGSGKKYKVCHGDPARRNA